MSEQFTGMLLRPVCMKKLSRGGKVIFPILVQLWSGQGNLRGRSPNDRFIVREPSTESKIWWSTINKGIEEKKFTHLFHRLQAYFQNKDLFIQDCYAGAARKYKIPIRVITETAWHSLFARNMFIQMKSPQESRDHHPEFTIINAPRFHSITELDGTSSEAFILLHLGKKLVLIGGTSYAGEIRNPSLPS